MIIDIPGIYLAGITGLAVILLAAYGASSFAFDLGWLLDDRFEWDRPSWWPWTWRAYRRWFGPGQLVASDDFDEAEVLDVDFGPDRHPMDTWVKVRPHVYRARTDVTDRPVWLPLADLMPAAVGRFADDDNDFVFGVTRDGDSVTVQEGGPIR